MCVTRAPQSYRLYKHRCSGKVHERDSVIVLAMKSSMMTSDCGGAMYPQQHGVHNVIVKYEQTLTLSKLS